MSESEPPRLYKKYYIDKGDERRELFKALTAQFEIRRAVYPGSFVHITPSFSIREMMYIDSDKRVHQFFHSKSAKEYVEENKEYGGPARFTGLQADFTGDIDVPTGYYDALFSFYSGFVSRACKKYLKSGGILIANNSHGDASIAFTDPDYELIGAIQRRGVRFSITDKNRDQYFKKRDGSPIDVEKILNTMTGEKFTKTAYAYIFRKQVSARDTGRG